MFVVSLYLIKSLSIYLAVLIPLVLLMLGVPFRRLKAGWIPIGLFLLFTFLGNTINQHGTVLLTAGPLMITREGLYAGTFRTLRVLMLIAGIKILMSGLSTEALIQALGNLLAPVERLGLPVKDFIHTMGLTLKCFPVLNDMAAGIYRERVRQEEVRGFAARIKLVAGFLMPLFIKSVRSPEIFFGPGDEHVK